MSPARESGVRGDARARDPGRADVRVVKSAPDHAEALEELQRICFPGLAEEERMKAEHFLEHQRRFPAGEYVALARTAPDGSPLTSERVVGLGSGFLTDFDLERPDHAFIDIIAGGTYANHDPDGDWYYGADISVHPDYRGHGIGGRLYQARKGVVTRLGKKGIVAGGALPGYRDHRDALSVEEYVAKIAARELYDPTLAFQIANGFEVLGVIRDYMTDEVTGNAASLIVWRNPDAAPDGYRVRPARPKDAAAVAAVIGRRQRVDVGSVEVDEQVVRDDWVGIDFDADTVIVEQGGVVRACADLMVRSGQVSAYAYVDPEVVDEETRRELGAFLAAWAEARAGEELRAADELRATEGLRAADELRVADSLPPVGTGVVVRHYAVDTNPEAVGLLEDRGYAFQRSVLWMERELGSALTGADAATTTAAPRTLPAGLTLRTYRGERDEPAVHQAFEDGSLDMNGRAPNTLEQWRAYVGTKDTDLVFIVESGGAAGPGSLAAAKHGEIVGILIASVSGSERDEQAAALGHVDSLRVVRSWRRRGIGAALLAHSFAELAARGATKVGLSVDAASPAGAPNLYLDAGMHVTRRYLVMEKIVAVDG